MLRHSRKGAYTLELIPVKGNTYYIVGRQLMPVYRVDETNCILMDPGRKNEREGIEAALAKAGLHPAGILITHMHYDHHENSSYFIKKYGSLLAMTRQDAELCRDFVSLRNHLYTFSPGLLHEQERLSGLICHTDYPILPNETKIHFAGADFGVLHTPGHSPSHACFITPDDVCFAGDCLMTEEDLAVANMPFVFDLAEDLRSKQTLVESKHDYYLFSHLGVRQGSLQELLEKNLQLIDKVLETFLRNVPAPRSLCEIYAAVNTELDMHTGHPLRHFYLERYLRPYLDYLVDERKLVPVAGGGAPTLAPPEFAQ